MSGIPGYYFLEGETVANVNMAKQLRVFPLPGFSIGLHAKLPAKMVVCDE